MNVFRQPVLLRWADMDPNGHVRHSVYYDLGASARVAFLSAYGVTYEMMDAHHFGPILFREEAVFRQEMRYGDDLWINLLVSRLRRDGSRFSFRHEITRTDGTLCATINVDGAWIDTTRRKLTIPPDSIREMFEAAPKSSDFEWQ
ncbi:MAG: thioesterase family protein [Saprospiraceae bacterium]|jgi:acyl-CoA thioester hydrolase|nr:thioesterase family protein [Saprospiraceae bacterium]